MVSEGGSPKSILSGSPEFADMSCLATCLPPGPVGTGPSRRIPSDGEMPASRQPAKVLRFYLRRGSKAIKSYITQYMPFCQNSEGFCIEGHAGFRSSTIVAAHKTKYNFARLNSSGWVQVECPSMFKFKRTNIEMLPFLSTQFRLYNLAAGCQHST